MHVEVRINFTHASIFVQPAEYVDAEILCTSIYWKKKKKKDKRERGDMSLMRENDKYCFLKSNTL